MKKAGIEVASTVIAAALAMGGCVSKGEYEKLQSERDGLEQRVKDLESQRSGLEKEKAQLERVRGDLRSELVAVEKQRAELAMANQQASSRYEAVVRDLGEEVKKGELRVRQYKDMLTVEVAEQLFFDSGRATLKESGRALLKKVGEALKGYDDKVIRVVGHTDNVPIGKAMQAQFPSNWDLSAARATTVVRFLESTGVPPERLLASGRGEYSPVASNDDAEGRKRNRRIEITLVDKGLAQELQAR
jgi:chemotaxis protein MotB